MKSRNWPPKGLPFEATFAPAIAVSRYENGGPLTHVAKREIADSFVQKYDFQNLRNMRKFAIPSATVTGIQRPMSKKHKTLVNFRRF